MPGPDAAPSVLVAGLRRDDAPRALSSLSSRIQLAFADTAEGVAACIEDADVIFAWRPDRRLLEHALAVATRLRWIQTASAGVDGLLFPALVESDVIVTNARGVFDDAMAEYAIACILVFAKDLATTIADSRRGEWHYRYTEPVEGRRLLVLGPGPIGTAVARRATALGLRAEAIGSGDRPASAPYERVRGPDALLDALSGADYVVNTLPLTEATRHVLSDAAFDAMRPTARLVNLGRGATVDEAALVRALQRGAIAGAALDVFEAEPLPPDSPLWRLPNVIVSPHMSGDTVGWEGRVVDAFARNLDRWIGGLPLDNVVDKARGYVPTR